MTSVSIASLRPWLALIVVLAALFGLPTLVKWFQDGTWRGGLYVDSSRSPWLDLLLAVAVTATVFAARDTHAAQVWYTTAWWHVTCLLATAVFALLRWKVGPSYGRQVMTTGGEPRYVRNIVYTVIAGWMVALIPTILLSGPVWARPITVLVLVGLFALSVFAQRVIGWANHADEHLDAMEGRFENARARLSH